MKIPAIFLLALLAPFAQACENGGAMSIRIVDDTCAGDAAANNAAEDLVVELMRQAILSETGVDIGEGASSATFTSNRPFEGSASQNDLTSITGTANDITIQDDLNDGDNTDVIAEGDTFYDSARITRTRALSKSKEGFLRDVVPAHHRQLWGCGTYCSCCGAGWCCQICNWGCRRRQAAVVKDVHSGRELALSDKDIKKIEKFACKTLKQTFKRDQTGIPCLSSAKITKCKFVE